jgi:hypothetical protein
MCDLHNPRGRLDNQEKVLRQASRRRRVVTIGSAAGEGTAPLTEQRNVV